MTRCILLLTLLVGMAFNGYVMKYLFSFLGLLIGVGLAVGVFWVISGMDGGGVSMARSVAVSVVPSVSGVRLPEFLVSFDKGLAHSDLYAPTGVETKVASDSVRVGWEFADKKLTVGKGVHWEYGVLSGFRVYRDGFWLADVGKGAKEYVDSGLSPGETYRYGVSGLTFDDKIEGLKSASVAAVTMAGDSGKAVVFPTKGKDIKTYLAEGDSITEGKQVQEGERWVSLVGEFLRKSSPDLKVVNKGVTGSLSLGVLERLPKELSEYKPDLVSVAVGTNDMTGAARDVGNMSMGEFRDALQKIIGLVRADPKRDLVLLNIYYFGCCDAKRVAWNRMIADIGREDGVLVVDVEGPMERGGGKSLVEGLHPNAKGHGVIGESVIGALGEYVK